MTFVVSLTGLRPPARFDGIAWTDARIEEAELRVGPFTALETQRLTPVDTDPRTPAERSLTTVLATLQAGWYRVVFSDGTAESESEPVTAAQPGHLPADILPPIPSDIRNRSALLRSLLPAGSPDPYVEPTLRQSVADSTALVQAITLRTLDATLPAELIDLALRAVTLEAEKLATGSAQDEAEAAAGGRRVRSESAGPWSVTYFAPGELAMKNGRPMVDPNPALDEVLWALMTEEAREEFLALVAGEFVPAGAVTPIDYRRVGGGYGWGL